MRRCLERSPRAELKYGENPEAKRMAERIINDQSKEMIAWGAGEPGAGESSSRLGSIWKTTRTVERTRRPDSLSDRRRVGIGDLASGPNGPTAQPATWA